MKSEITQMREDWIREAEVVLGVGKGHLGVINMLRSYGMSVDSAKKASFDIFDEAKKRLMKSQRWQRLTAWIMIIGGILLPLIMLLSGVGIYVFSFAPLIAGFGWLFKLPNPSRLPKNNVSEQVAASDR